MLTLDLLLRRCRLVLVPSNEARTGANITLTEAQIASGHRIASAMASGDVAEIRAANRASREQHGEDVHSVLKVRAMIGVFGGKA